MSNPEAKPPRQPINPYQPPQTYAWVGPGAWGGTGEVRVSLVARSLAYRRLLLTGPITADIEYNGRGLGYETVYVDGQIVSRLGAPWTLAPCHHFTLAAGDVPVAALIEVRGIVRVCGFRLWLGDDLVYAEGRF